ncbi:MAG: hypothetical protein ABJB61_07825 [bacterium]
MSFEEQQPETTESSELTDVVRAEDEFLQERLRKDLGREPTAEELDEWLRQHTEAY